MKLISLQRLKKINDKSRRNSGVKHNSARRYYACFVGDSYGYDAKTSSVQKKDLTVIVDATKKVRIDQNTMDLRELPDNIVLIGAKYDKNSPVYIKADKSLIYDDVMFVLKSVKNAGFTKVALQTNG